MILVVGSSVTIILQIYRRINHDEVGYVTRRKTECNHNKIMNVINLKKTHKITYIIDDDIHANARLHTNSTNWITSYACLVDSSAYHYTSLK